MRRTFLSMWFYWLPPAVLSLVLAIALQSPFAGEWDSMDYTVYSTSGFTPSSMLLGRMGFLFTNRLVFLLCNGLFGLPADSAYILFKYLVIAQTPLAVVALWVLTRELTHSARAATLGAFMLALTPFFLFAGGQVMTEVPSILVMCAALTIHLRALRKKNTWMVILSAVLLGFAVNIREGVALFGGWLAVAPFAYGWKPNKHDLLVTISACVVFLLVALGPFAIWFYMDPDFHGRWLGWLAGSKREAVLHPVSIQNLPRFCQLCLATAPLVFLLTPFALWREWRSRGTSGLFLMGAVGTFATVALYSHYSMVLHPRYFLTGLPGLIPLVAFLLYRFTRKNSSRLKPAWTERFRNFLSFLSRARFVLTLVLVLTACSIATLLRLPQHIAGQWTHLAWKNYRTQLEALPKKNSVVMASGMTVAVNYWRNVGAGEWIAIGYGCGWPGDNRLVTVIDGHIKKGKRVFVDLNRSYWPTWSWQSNETASLPKLEGHFRFRKVPSDKPELKYMYEICSLSDASANDHPDLNLIPAKKRFVVPAK